ncbi:4-hydroxy-tetrahydrodipicolinate synthase [Enterococcus sp. UD-01]|jgi:4-hydroxy-tetrahydrodipicolinate synthase|uniref:4-hydroxy-tetrahydrodipicolinate synthase n=1 Tax=Enterococcus sp. UD-01 TaxID=3373911 RepID=UPI003839531F
MKVAGIISAMVTPFTADGKINEAATRQLVNHLIDQHINGLFILGTNGEFHVLSKEEKLAFAKIVVEAVAGRVPVYAGSGGNSTEEVIALTNAFAEVGVDAVSVISPYFVPLTEEELFTHYQTIAAQANIPILLYNIPKNTGNPLSSQLVARLAKLPNIIGIKDSSGDIELMKEHIEKNKEEDFVVLSGSDSLILKALKLGAAGAVAATSNVLSKTDVAIYTHFKNGDLAEAQAAQDSIEEFRRILKFGTIPSVLKYSLSFMGIDVGAPRTPTLPVADPEKIQEMNKVLTENYATEKI